jgi:hypothetical protein
MPAMELVAAVLIWIGVSVALGTLWAILHWRRLDALAVAAAASGTEAFPVAAAPSAPEASSSVPLPAPRRHQDEPSKVND